MEIIRFMVPRDFNANFEVSLSGTAQGSIATNYGCIPIDHGAKMSCKSYDQLIFCLHKGDPLSWILH